MASLVLVAASAASNYPKGGLAWERLSWPLGLRRLGFDVLVVDQLYRGLCRAPDGVAPTYENCLNRPFFEATVKQFGLSGSAALLGDHGESLYGPSYAEVLDMAEAAEMLVNLQGDLLLPEIKRRSRLKVYVDTDPGFTHLWLAAGKWMPRILGHDLHFTIGENVGTPACSLPTGGLMWKHTRQPVLLDEWPVSAEGDPNRFTSVAAWRGTGPHGRLEEAGFRFGQKADELAKVIDLPRRAPQTFELALLMAEADKTDRPVLESHGWRVVDGTALTADMSSFRRYVQNSGAEFSVAKGVYVETATGWFSDRTTRYLASGKPALVQDTAFGRHIPVGEGVLTFRTLDDAADGAARIAADYASHSRAARQIAEEYFDSDEVLTRFLEDVDASR